MFIELFPNKWGLILDTDEIAYIIKQEKTDNRKDFPYEILINFKNGAGRIVTFANAKARNAVHRQIRKFLNVKITITRTK